MWTELPCQNFHLLLCCAILESEKQQIMEKQYGFNEILKVLSSCVLFNSLMLMQCLLYFTLGRMGGGEDKYHPLKHYI